MPLEPGTRLGHHEIIETIGQGGMGEVYRARDTSLGREVAIKTLPAELAHDEERLARFRREAQLLASLNHPNIASIYGFEQHDDTSLLVLELVAGEDLSERLKRGPIPVEEALALARAIAEALEEAHENGVIHRDLKPGNVKLTPDGKVKVLDFGLAKAFAAGSADASSPELSRSPTMTRGTGTGMILGTAAYMSPEQAKGKDLDRRSDVFSFGALLFEMLTGRKAFSGDDVSETLAAILRDEPEWSLLPAATPLKARELLSRCLQKNPRERLRDIGDARLQLDDALRDEAPTTVVSMKRTSWLGYALAGTVGAAVCAAVFWALPRTAPPATRRFSVSLPAIETLIRGPGSPIVLTPDGATLVYAGQRGNQAQLYRRRVNELEATAIDRTSGARHPFVSPDGRSLGFYLGGLIYTAPLDGGLPTKIADLGSPPSGPAGAASWGTDGFVYFARSESDPLFRVPANGGEPESITRVDVEAGELAHLWPEALPNGKGVLFTIWSGSLETTKLGVHSLETGSHQVLSPGTQPRYVPTGHILFVKDLTLYAAPFDAHRLGLTGPAVPVVVDVEVNPSGAGQFTVTSNGLLAYVERTGTGLRDTLIWVDRTGAVVEKAIEDPEQGFASFRLAPDGRRVAVQTSLPRAELWVYDLTGRPPIPLRIESSTWSPVWEPAGAHVAFLGQAPSSLYRIAADGSESEPEILYENVNLEALWTFTPDGEILAEMPVDGARDLVRVPVEVVGGEARPVFQSVADETEAALSPDGRWLAYTSDATGRYEIWLRPFDRGGIPIRVSRNGGNEPAWSADGTELFFRYRGPDRDTPDLFAASVVTDPELRIGTPHRLFKFPYVTPYTPTYAVGSDGRFLMREGVPARGSGEIVLVLDWFSELERLAPTH